MAETAAAIEDIFGLAESSLHLATDLTDMLDAWILVVQVSDPTNFDVSKSKGKAKACVNITSCTLHRM